MTSASKILESKGITLRVIGEELSLSPKENVTPEVVQFAKAHKKQIMAELEPFVIYHNPYSPDTKEARIESLIQVMDAIYRNTFKKVREAYEQSGIKFKSTQDILSIEQRIETIQHAVLKGDAKLQKFQAAVDKWAKKANLN